MIKTILIAYFVGFFIFLYFTVRRAEIHGWNSPENMKSVFRYSTLWPLMIPLLIAFIFFVWIPLKIDKWRYNAKT